MSPEQFKYDPRDIDTRADIYALGVVLYELLAGSLPYDVSGKPVPEVARTIREAPPQPMRDLATPIADELEIIVNKALQKDRQQRYQSAYGIAQDLRRFLAGEAIFAKAPSLLYQVRVVARRNKLLTGSMAALFVLLIIGITITTTLWLQVDAARQRAEAESARVETARHFLAEVISSTAPVGYFDRVSIADVLDRASPKVSEVLADDPLAEAEVRHSLGLGYLRIARNQQAEDHLLRALALYKQELGTEHDRTLQILGDISFLYSITGEFRKGLEIVGQKAAARQSRFGRHDPKTLAAQLSVASYHAARNDMAAAIDLTRRTLEIYQQTLGSDNRLTHEAQIQYAWLLVEQGQFAEAEQLASEDLRRAQASFGNHDDLTKGARSVLAAALLSQGRVKECHALYDNKPLPANLGIEYEFQGEPSVDRGWDLLLFWETWCPFSERAVPYYETIYKQYRDAGLDILGLTECRAGSNDDEVRKFISEKNLSFAIARDNGRPANYYGCDGVPSVRLLDDGELIWESNGYTSRYMPRSMLEGLIAAK
jgi:tetratricopeptide (TPR) repeat protein